MKQLDPKTKVYILFVAGLVIVNAIAIVLNVTIGLAGSLTSVIATACFAFVCLVVGTIVYIKSKRRK